jgi:hypothetical protein
VFFNLFRFTARFKGLKKFGGNPTWQKWLSEASLVIGIDKNTETLYMYLAAPRLGITALNISTDNSNKILMLTSRSARVTIYPFFLLSGKHQFCKGCFTL